jgi:hypothetical protein
MRQPTTRHRRRWARTRLPARYRAAPID